MSGILYRKVRNDQGSQDLHTTALLSYSTVKSSFVALILPALLSGKADHIIFNRIVITPTNGELVSLYNPTNLTVDLSDYYITDAVKQSSNKYYYNLPSGNDYWSSHYADFVARFPQNIEMLPGDTLVLGLHNDSLFSDYYGYTPDLSLFEDMRNAIDGVTTISVGEAFVASDMLGNNAEVLILFKWESGSSVVQDVDYFLWGNNTHAVDKTGVAGYSDDTPIDNQSYMTAHEKEFSYKRVSNQESGETTTGGNGITGHDETSEELTSSWLISVYPEPEDWSIDEIVDDLTSHGDTSIFIGKTVTIDGVVTVPAGVLWKVRSQAYLQDESGRGIILDKSLPLDESLTRGDSILITADVEVYQGTPELINYKATILDTGVTVPYVEISIADFNTLNYMYTYVKLWGRVVSRSDPGGTNTGANIDIQDDTGEVTTVRIWNSANLLFNEDFELVNPELDSLLQVGSIIEVYGIGGEYSGASQIQPAFPEDIAEKLEGVPGNFTATLKVAPYPFVPQLGEVISYTYSFPDNARIKLRVFDLSGRHVTTLFDEFRSVSFYKQATWNGRNELNEIVDPGVYIMHLEVTDRETGKLSTAIAPIVVGTRMK